MPFQSPPRPRSGLASVLAAAGIVLTAAGCSHLAPLGPGPTPVAMPPSRHLGSPIIVQVMRSRPPTASGGCPAGWTAVSLPRGGEPHRQRAGTGSAPAPLAAMPCYRPAGTPVTITSAAVSSVLTNHPPPGQPKGPASYGFMVAVPAADVAAVTAVIRQAYDSAGAVGISIAGKLWQAPRVVRPFPGQQLEISLPSKNQALQLYRMLVPPG